VCHMRTYGIEEPGDPVLSSSKRPDQRQPWLFRRSTGAPLAPPPAPRHPAADVRALPGAIWRQHFVVRPVRKATFGPVTRVSARLVVGSLAGMRVAIGIAFALVP